jgi:hypothetical protein
MMQPPSPRLGALIALAVGLTACGSATAANSASRHAAAPPDPPVRTAPCPDAAPAQFAANSWSAARSELAPAGPTAILLCRYAGLNALPRRALTRTALITNAATVASLVRGFDRLPSASGTFNCPLDDGSEIVALLTYPHGRMVTISVHLRGCQMVTNGDLRRTAAGTSGQPGPTLVAQLERLTS